MTVSLLIISRDSIARLSLSLSLSSFSARENFWTEWFSCASSGTEVQLSQGCARYGVVMMFLDLDCVVLALNRIPRNGWGRHFWETLPTFLLLAFNCISYRAIRGNNFRQFWRMRVQDI